jgi:hypothetical protein
VVDVGDDREISGKGCLIGHGVTRKDG